ncbi:MAG TPA: LamG domain-containing protein [Pyrinomonadaceae bacterium]|nr:LamG domain-containing protein [Pyrinomonadaceae bacterium]
MRFRGCSTVLLLTIIIAIPASAQRISHGGSSSAGTVRVDLSRERPGRESTRFLAVVGNWLIVDDGGKRVLGVDGRSWLRGQPAGSLAEKARTIYGSRNEEFIDNVKAWAYFPYAVARDIQDFRDGDISIRFKIVAGQLDQCAGILFNLKSNGDYLTVRFNGMEDNVVLWTFNKGVRKFVKKGSENVPLTRNQWHTLQISVRGTNLQASLNGKHLLDYTLPEPVSGKVGVWAKTDSVSYFDDYTVSR